MASHGSGRRREPGTPGMLLSGSGRLAPVGRSPWAIQVRDGRIAWLGDPADAPTDDERHDLGEALVTPGLVDSHTHPVFVGDRSDEAAARLEGAPYTEGGILRTVRATRAADDATLEARSSGACVLRLPRARPRSSASRATGFHSTRSCATSASSATSANGSR